MLSVHSLMQEAKVAPRERARLGRKEERRMMAEAIEDLPELDRLILGLRYYESVRPAQIAAVLGLPEDEVRRLLAQALERIAAANGKDRVPVTDKGPAHRAIPARRGNGKGRA